MKTVCTGVPPLVYSAPATAAASIAISTGRPPPCAVCAAARDLPLDVLHGSMTSARSLDPCPRCSPARRERVVCQLARCRLVARTSRIGRSRWMANRHAAPPAAGHSELGVRAALASSRQISRPRPASGVIRSHGNGSRPVAALTRVRTSFLERREPGNPARDRGSRRWLTALETSNGSSCVGGRASLALTSELSAR